MSSREIDWRLFLLAALHFWLCIGDPDLLDAIKWWLMQTDECSALGVSARGISLRALGW